MRLFSKWDRREAQQQSQELGGRVRLVNFTRELAWLHAPIPLQALVTPT